MDTKNLPSLSHCVLWLRDGRHFKAGALKVAKRATRNGAQIPELPYGAIHKLSAGTKTLLEDYTRAPYAS